MNSGQTSVMPSRAPTVIDRPSCAASWSGTYIDEKPNLLSVRPLPNTRISAEVLLHEEPWTTALVEPSMTMQRNCPVCIGYALVEADVTEHEDEAGAAFDDQYETVIDLRDAHVERVHAQGSAD